MSAAMRDTASARQQTGNNSIQQSIHSHTHTHIEIEIDTGKNTSQNDEQISSSSITRKILGIECFWFIVLKGFLLVESQPMDRSMERNEGNQRLNRNNDPVKRQSLVPCEGKML